MLTTAAPPSRIGKPAPVPAGSLLKRRCACGQHTVAGGACAHCAKQNHDRHGAAPRLGRGAAMEKAPAARSLPAPRAPMPARPATRSPIQASLVSVSSAKDRAEVEARETASKIMRMPTGSAVLPSPVALPTTTPALLASKPTAPALPAPAPAAITPRASGGSPLPADVREYMEPRFGADFSGVRIHTDAHAAHLSRQMAAHAFAVGSDLYFGEGKFQPRTHDGRELIAHELTHTIQQRAAPPHADRAVHRSAYGSIVVAAPVGIQKLGLDDALDYVATQANLIPGFRMFTLILGVNPVNMHPVDRSAANILRALVELLPAGGLITKALDNYGVFDKAGVFVEEQLATMGMAAGPIKQALSDFLNSLSWTDVFSLDSVWERAKHIFTGPIDRIIETGKGLVTQIVQFIKDAILKPLGQLAQSNTPSYDLLKGVLGQDPITGENVPRSAETLIGPFMKLIGQEDVWENMKKANAIPRCWAWFQKNLASLMGFVKQIPDLFLKAFHDLQLEDIVVLPNAFLKLAKVFGSFIGKFMDWGLDAALQLLEIIVQAINPDALTYLKKTGAALKDIIRNPMPFVGNLVKAAKLGFQNFGSNFLTHLKSGLIDWLTGALPDVYIPKALSLPEVGKFALSVLGITWAQIRGKIVKALGPNGPTIMTALEKTFDVVIALVTGGPAAAWKQIEKELGNLKDMVIGGITGFITDIVVKKAIPKLISMFIPGAGFISAIMSIYDTVMVFVHQLQKIAAVIKGFVDSIVAIAGGAIDAAAGKVESILGNLLSLAINFLAGFAGLGDVAEKISGVLEKVRGFVDKALDTAINWIITKAKSLFARLFGKQDAKDDRTEPEKLSDLKKAVADGQQIATDKKFSNREKKKQLAKLKTSYRLASIELVTDNKLKEKENVHVHAEINPTFDGAGFVIDVFPPEPTVVVEAWVAAPVPRAGMEKVLQTPGAAGLSGYERAHLLGPGLGHDLPQGVLYAPRDVNQDLQNWGIEHMIREVYAQRYPGAEFKVVLTALPHPGTELLAKANYQLYGHFPGEPLTFIFEYTIKVGRGSNPSVKVLAGDADVDALNRLTTGATSVIATRLPADV